MKKNLFKLFCLVIVGFAVASCGGGGSSAELPGPLAKLLGNTSPPAVHNGVEMGTSIEDVKAKIKTGELDYQAEDGSNLSYMAQMEGASEVVMNFDFEDGKLVDTYLDIYFENEEDLNSSFDAATGYFKGIYGSPSTKDDDAHIFEGISKGSAKNLLIQKMDGKELMIEFDTFE